MKNYSTKGLVLAKRDYSEADKILIIFTRDFGKVSTIAKGVKKLKSRKRGHLEIFSHIKFSAAKGRGLDIITEAETINNFQKIRKNLKKASVAYFFVEAVGRTIREGEKNENVYDLLLDYLQKLETETKLKNLRNNFTQELLVMLGFWPKDRTILDPDIILEQIIEKKPNSIRVGKRLQT